MDDGERERLWRERLLISLFMWTVAGSTVFSCFLLFFLGSWAQPYVQGILSLFLSPSQCMVYKHLTHATHVGYPRVELFQTELAETHAEFAGHKESPAQWVNRVDPRMVCIPSKIFGFKYRR